MPTVEPSMACPLLNKLPVEFRRRIYEHVLYFDDVPLRHLTQLQAFVRKLTGADGELPFSYEDSEERDPELDWIMVGGDELFSNTPINTGVLSTCKTIYTEASRVFYEQNIISVDIELFKLQNVNSPAASDLSLTKRLVVKFNSSCDWDDQMARSFNTIDLRNLFARCGATFPNLQSIIVYTDGTTLPCTSLIDIFQHCYNSPHIFTNIDFCNVGQFAASTHSGITLTVKYKELVELWQEICDPMSSSRTRPLHSLDVMHDSLAKLTHQAFLTKMVFGNTGDDDTREHMERFREALVRYSPNRPMPFLNDNVFWTHLASPYVWYSPA